jgi:hypothetical protein
MPTDNCAYGNEAYFGWAAHSPKDLQFLGGFDHKALAYGNWLGFYQAALGSLAAQGWWCSMPAGPPSVAWTQGAYVGAQCDYNYRNVPAVITIDKTGPGQPVIATSVYLGYTKPAVAVEAGSATFKTQKLLGGRALVTDSFSKRKYMQRFYEGGSPGWDGTWSDPFGKAQYAHRAGYNALYGDWSAKWYGDDDGVLMWWPDTTDPRELGWGPFGGSDDNRFTTGAYAIQSNVIMKWTRIPGSTATADANGSPVSSVDAWHLFDVAAGIDGQ